LGTKLPSSKKYGQTTINLGRIEGGVAANVVAETAKAQIAIRIAAGTPDGIKKKVTKVINDAVKGFKTSEDDEIIEFQFASAGYAPVDIDHDVDGFDSFTVNYGTDIPNFESTVKEQKRYLYGPGSILVAHSDHEAITVGELEEAVEGYQRLILHSLKN
jgi:acetylornithine deacetylase